MQLLPSDGQQGAHHSPSRCQLISFSILSAKLTSIARLFCAYAAPAGRDDQDFASAGSLLAPDFSHQMWPSTMRGGAPATMRAPKDVWMDRQAQFQEGFINAFNVSHPFSRSSARDRGIGVRHALISYPIF